MPCKTKVDNERARFWVHASCEHDVNKLLLLLKMVSVVHDSIVDDLSDETDWGLCTVSVQVRHVEIIHEIDQSLAWWWSICSSGSLVNLRFDDDLKGLGVSVRVEVDGSIQDGILVQSGEIVLHNGSLSSSG